MKILDKYILGKFFTTLVFMIVLLSFVFVVIDINAKYTNSAENGFGLVDALTQFYPYYLIWAINTFFSILVFISVLYFTSRITNNTEVVAIISSGISFYRFSIPYIFGALIITLLSLTINPVIFPYANIKKNEFAIKTMRSSKKQEYYSQQKIASQIGPKEYLFINSYSRVNKSGNGFMYQKFDSINQLTHELSANYINWSEIDTTYILRNYRERIIHPGKPDELITGNEIKQKFQFTPDELLPESYVAETMNSFELSEFIHREKVKGSGNIGAYKFELYSRTSLPISVIILTILAMSLASVIKRGGIGLNLAIGITIAFVFIFSFQALSAMSTKSGLNPLFATWLPNIVFGILALYLYLKRAFS